MANRSFNTVALFNAAKSTLAGDSGSDTLSFSGATASIALSDSDFGAMNAATVSANVKWEYLAITANYANQATLGANAQDVGIVSVFGGSGNDVVNVSAYSLSATLSGGGGNDSLIGGAGSDYLAACRT